MSKDLTSDVATSEWLNSQKKSTRSAYKSSWLHFLEFAKLSGDQILADRKTDKEFKWEKQVLAAKTWLIETKGLSENTAKSVTTAARSFFAFHRVGLEFRKPEKARLKEAHAKSEDYRFSVGDLQKMFNVANLTEKYVLTVGKSFGLRAGDFMKLTKGDLEAYIDREPPISIGAYSTQKEGVKAYPFIDADAQPIIKLMLDKMTREGRTRPSERMLTYTNKLQLTRVLKRLVQKAGLNVGNKNVKFHCLRKFLIDRISSVMSESKWKQVVGKKISEGAYISPESLREDYARVMTETTFTKPTLEGGLEKRIKKEVLLTIARTMGMGESEVQTIFAAKQQDIDKEIEALEKIIDKKRQTEIIEAIKSKGVYEEWAEGLTEEEKEVYKEMIRSMFKHFFNSEKKPKNEDCANGAHCSEDFKQIGEDELLEHLKAGWKVTHKLGDGDLIVQR